jgi:hypothetical protein
VPPTREDQFRLIEYLSGVSALHPHHFDSDASYCPRRLPTRRGLFLSLKAVRFGGANGNAALSGYRTKPMQA